jgi:F-type H+-transporting ATPase subunit c
MKSYGMKVLFAMGAVLMASPVFAQTADAAASSSSASVSSALAIAAAFGMAIAAGLCGLGQGKVGAAACEGIARNPQAGGAIQTAMLLGLAFIETLVLFTFVMIILKVNA